MEHDRLIAEELSREGRCDVKARDNELGTELTAIWHRAFRYRAEREATANALRLRGGKPRRPHTCERTGQRRYRRRTR